MPEGHSTVNTFLPLTFGVRGLFSVCFLLLVSQHQMFTRKSYSRVVSRLGATEM